MASMKSPTTTTRRWDEEIQDRLLNRDTIKIILLNIYIYIIYRENISAKTVKLISQSISEFTTA